MKIIRVVAAKRFERRAQLALPTVAQPLGVVAQQPEPGGLFVEITVRYRMSKAAFGLIRSDCEAIWEARGEMPARLADEIPEAAWDQHREAILELVAESLGK
ncbi:hypothetical protein [Halomonas sp. IOP_31]|uniref:hypothetical protein n=1 Tax=Halomonas sp. IOP_31 TaxID=2876584 RepID=UPI001E3E97CF|nr:hypothetical protein [Halomonas sp. IOP_31]MCD6006922.1 hypothetical protein [Halomonas sp. IOP_31]